MSLLATIEAFFGRAEKAVVSTLSVVEAGFKACDTAAGVVLGQIEAAGALAGQVDAPLGAAITAGAASMLALKTDIDGLFNSGAAEADAVGQQVLQLSGMIVTLSGQIAPFYDATVKQVSQVSADAVSAAKAIAPIAAAA